MTLLLGTQGWRRFLLYDGQRLGDNDPRVNRALSPRIPRCQGDGVDAVFEDVEADRMMALMAAEPMPMAVRNEPKEADEKPAVLDQARPGQARPGQARGPPWINQPHQPSLMLPR